MRRLQYIKKLEERYRLAKERNSPGAAEIGLIINELRNMEYAWMTEDERKPSRTTAENTRSD